jgi:hypothetical protein
MSIFHPCRVGIVPYVSTTDACCVNIPPLILLILHLSRFEIGLTSLAAMCVAFELTQLFRSAFLFGL